MCWSKTHEIESKYKLIFTLPLKLLIFIIDHAESCFFFPSLTHFFITATCRRFSTSPAQARKQYAHTKICFSFKMKDWIILFELEGILKNNLRLFKLDSKTLLVYNSAMMSTKVWRLPQLIMTCDINPLEPILAQIVMRHSK